MLARQTNKDVHLWFSIAFPFFLLSVFSLLLMYLTVLFLISSVFSFTCYPTSNHDIILLSISFPLPIHIHFIYTPPAIPLPPRYRCLEEEGSLLDLEGLPNFPKSLEGLRKAASGEQSFDVKDLFNTSLESETLKETLYRQAKTQVCGWSSDAGR